MGWRGYKGTIDVGMLFKKMFCQNCGTRLRIKKNSQIINKGDKELCPQSASIDRYGVNRFERDSVDIGAYVWVEQIEENSKDGM
jgi:RNase P subunit RPR2